MPSQASSLALLVLALSGCGPRVHPMTSVDDGVAQSSALLETLPADKPGCSIAVSEAGVVLWSGARGLADVTSRRPLDTGTIFDIASTSKQFTALLVLLLAKDHALTLQDSLASHVVGLPAWANDVTLEQLVHHRSGIPDYTDLLTKRGVTLTASSTQQDALAAIAAATLTFTPGSKFAYSNSNYVLLAEVVRAATGKPLPVVLDERVFHPLGLDMRMDPAFDAPAVAVPYVMQGLSLVESRSRWLQVGDGSIFTTPTQLAKWGDSYRTGAVGGLDLIAAALDAAVATDTPGDSYGPGIDLASDGKLSHSGAWSGFATVFVVSADRTRVLAMSCNSFEMNAPTTVGQGLMTIWLEGHCQRSQPCFGGACFVTGSPFALRAARVSSAASFTSGAHRSCVTSPSARCTGLPFDNNIAGSVCERIAVCSSSDKRHAPFSVKSAGCSSTNARYTSSPGRFRSSSFNVTRWSVSRFDSLYVRATSVR